MRLLRRTGIVLALALVGAACDDVAGPDTAILAAGTAPALRAAAGLPSLPDLIRRTSGPDSPGGDASRDAELVRALALWAEADAVRTGPTSERRAVVLRERAIRLAAPTLARRLGAAEALRLEAKVEAVVELARAAGEDAPDATLRVAAARAAASLAAAHDGRAADRLAAVLLASEALRTAAPQAVASRLITDAKRLLGERLPTEHAAQGRTLLRATHLLRGAERAYAEGSYERAIQRAFYARLLLASD